MQTQSMPIPHQPVTGVTPWAWPLDGHQATTLAAEPVARWLRVEDGCVWVTAVDGGPQSEDIWLQPGQSLALPAGSAWVVEAWPRARLSLLQQVPRAAAVSRRAGWRTSWLRGLAA